MEITIKIRANNQLTNPVIDFPNPMFDNHREGLTKLISENLLNDWQFNTPTDFTDCYKKETLYEFK